MLEELTIWIEHKCFERVPRKGATNILDVRWVGKWKRIKAKADPTKTVLIIRMRMTLRGFKDRDAAELATFAGTSSRLSKRLVISEAVNRNFKVVAIDIKKAFLKGITYIELSRLTG